MEILMVAAELAPYVEGTEAAGAVASLSKALRQLGHNVTVAVPRQPGFEASGLMLARRLTQLPLLSGGEVPLLDAQLPSGVSVTLFDAPVLFDRPGVYGEAGEDYPDNARRFGLLSQAAASLVRQREQQGKAFDVVHLHDAPAALVPLALRRLPGPSVPTVLTIHDASRRGSFANDQAAALLPGDPDESLLVDGRLDVLRSGIANADVVTTVSPSYAAELVEGGKEIVGISNGLDYSIWNPSTDSALPSRYDAEDASAKSSCKTSVLRGLELELELERPLVLALGDADPARGFELVLGALPALVKSDLSLVVAGSMPAAALKKLKAARARAPERVGIVEGADRAALHRLFAAADLVLIPSRREPCGSAQLVAQRYGAAPVARAVGGLKDTVVDCDAALETGTGFLFDDDSSEALMGALGRGLAAFAGPAWSRLVRRIMRLDLGWDRPARRYLQIYRQTLASAR